MVSLTKRVLNWTEQKFEDIDENTKCPLLKSFGLGVVEGLIDGVVLMFPIALGALYYNNYKADKNKN